MSEICVNYTVAFFGSDIPEPKIELKLKLCSFWLNLPELNLKQLKCSLTQLKLLEFVGFLCLEDVTTRIFTKSS